MIGEIHGIPIVSVDEDIVAQARGVIGFKRIAVGNDFAHLPNAEQMAILQHEAAHCINYHLEIRVAIVAVLVGALFMIVDWRIVAAMGLILTGVVAMQALAHAQEYEADRFVSNIGYEDGLKAFLKRCLNLPPSDLHPSPRSRLRALSRKETA